MKAKKPKWTPIELYQNYQRWESLIHETDSHAPDCQCNRCMECYGLGELLRTFSQDEHAGAVIEANQIAGR